MLIEDEEGEVRGSRGANVRVLQQRYCKVIVLLNMHESCCRTHPGQCLTTEAALIETADHEPHGSANTRGTCIQARTAPDLWYLVTAGSDSEMEHE